MSVLARHNTFKINECGKTSVVPLFTVKLGDISMG